MTDGYAPIKAPESKKNTFNLSPSSTLPHGLRPSTQRVHSTTPDAIALAVSFYDHVAERESYASTDALPFAANPPTG